MQISNTEYANMRYAIRDLRVCDMRYSICEYAVCDMRYAHMRYAICEYAICEYANMRICDFLFFLFVCRMFVFLNVQWHHTEQENRYEVPPRENNRKKTNYPSLQVGQATLHRPVQRTHMAPVLQMRQTRRVHSHYKSETKTVHFANHSRQCASIK